MNLARIWALILIQHCARYNTTLKNKTKKIIINNLIIVCMFAQVLNVSSP